jgi:hypothetical protein
MGTAHGLAEQCLARPEAKLLFFCWPIGDRTILYHREFAQALEHLEQALVISASNTVLPCIPQDLG